MPRLTNAEYQAYLARHATPEARAVYGCDDESELHRQIVAEVNRRGWKCWNGRMDKRTGRDEGEPDFHIWAGNGIYFAVEAKTRTGKLRPEQQAASAWADKLKIKFFVVRSIEQFNEITNEVAKLTAIYL